MNHSTSQGKSKKQYVPPKVKAHGNVYQFTEGPGTPVTGSETTGYSM